MKKRLSLTLLLLIFVFVSLSNAQTESDKQINPYKDGESLTYEVKYKRLGFAFSIATLKFWIAKQPQSNNFLINSEAKSKGTLVSLFNFKLYQRYVSTIDGKRLRVLKTVKRDEQGDRVRLSEANFDYETKKVAYIETDPKDPSRPPRRVASTISLDTQDIISSIYMLRGKNLAVGKTFNFKVSDSGLLYDVPVKITARERKKTNFGKKWCWRIEPEIFGDGRIIEQKGSLTIWITDDEQRLPIRGELETKLGGVRIKLKKISNKNAVKSEANK